MKLSKLYKCNYKYKPRNC